MLIPQIAFGQVFMQGKVVDQETGAVLEAVEITSVDSNSTVFSDNQGFFNLKMKGEYQFSRKGYLTKYVSVDTQVFLIVQMNISPSELDEVVVHANQIPTSRKYAIASTEIVTKKEIERGNDINIAEPLNRVPGVFVQSGALNTNRFTIRGIGSRNLFGTSKIRAYFKDIPLTNGSGETTIEDFELAAISRVEILKGATSAIYGAGLGGTIQLTPENASLAETSLASQFTVGSYGLFKTIVNFNIGHQKNSYRAVYSNTHSDEYRDNNQYNRQTFTITSNHFINPKNSLATFVSLVDLKAFIPSSLSEDDFINSPTSAAFTWGNAKGFEDSKRAILGLTWDHQYTQNTKQVTSVFGSLRKGYEPRPFNILEENLGAYGIRSRFLGKTKQMKYTVGFEYFKDHYISKTFENLYQDFPPETGSVQGVLLSDFKEKRQYYNLFVEVRYKMTSKTNIVLGLNYNQTSYLLEDRFPVSNLNPDQSGRYSFEGILAPQFGVSQELSDKIILFANVSRGFSPLTLQETLLPNGQINNDLKPETGWNYELGLRGASKNGNLQWSTAFYRLSLKNLLVSRRTEIDQFIGVNAGESQHDGLEFQLNYDWVKKESFNLNTFLNYTRNDFVFKEFVDNDQDYSGNQLTGVPDQILNIGLDFYSKYGVYGNINFQHVGAQPMTDSNSLFSKAYQLTNIKLGYQQKFFSKLNFKVFFGVNNVFNEKYASQILINARSFGTSAPRYFYPGNPINYFGGLNVNYNF